MLGVIDINIDSLNARAQKLGYEIREMFDDPVLPTSEEPGVLFRTTMGHGGWVHVFRDDRLPAFKFSWKASEVDDWLKWREREAAQ